METPEQVEARVTDDTTEEAQTETAAEDVTGPAAAVASIMAVADTVVKPSLAGPAGAGTMEALVDLVVEELALITIATELEAAEAGRAAEAPTGRIPEAAEAHTTMERINQIRTIPTTVTAT
jgi:hypothetical protein